MNIQIFGIRKCFDTKKAERFFKERKINFQFIDLKMKAPSKGELQNIKNAVGLNNLINSTSKDYKKFNLDKIRGEETRMEVLLNNPQLYKTPIVRNGKKATIGYSPDTWNEWIKEQ
ncbi:arsenate reductase family protein [Clostridium sp. ATCC 25772]|uniref:arsenate reductase family protein n=1 Tax=Clostridium sp. ATCC 25772 TaxID=1676991 RepID=UPI000781DD70|nr:arsenate reductase family protein [Clostridium sp. ATCC 25772]